VWTPKRVLLLAGGFVLFFGAYLVYAFFLGGIDGLPSLPSGYMPIEGVVIEEPPPLATENSANGQLRLAFGEACPELGYKIKLELQPRGMVLATQVAKVLEDGRISLKPFSLAIIRKERGPTGWPEINTVQCKEAILRFEKPVKKIYDIGNGKIIGGELVEDVILINNRRTKRNDDDISLSTQRLFYDESRQLIWTDEEVKIEDLESKPQPMVILGKGMDVDLSNESRPGEAAQHDGQRGRNGPASVERIRLRNDVIMNLWVDAQSGFLTSGKKAPEGPAVAKPGQPVAGSSPEKAKVIINTQGPFVYDMRTDRAVFEVAHRPGPRENIITVDRFKELEENVDHLQCDRRLELQFRRKNPSTVQGSGQQGSGQGAQAKDGKEQGLDIETARALGKEVILTSDADVLHAMGTDFLYDRRTGLTTLKGSPVYVAKEGTEIRTAELQLLDQKGGQQQATALGEGEISLFGKGSSNQRPATNWRPLEASWKKKLIYLKQGNQDVITLVGDAVFKDNEHQQQLRAETLKVWLVPAEPVAGAESDQQRRKPEKLDAVERVSADGPELRIHDTDHLIVYFKDVPPSRSRPPAAVSPPGNDGIALPADDRSGGQANAGGMFPGSSTDPSRSKKPIDVSAKLVTTFVRRVDGRNDLDKVECEGGVRITQEPAAPGDRGVDIRGEFLKLDHFVDGNKLEVLGNNAQVQLNQICIIGPVVNIDQTTNRAAVRGRGAMRLPSKSNFDGTPLAHETELIVNWEKSMDFDGLKAEFKGAVKASQDQGHLATQEMTVYLDHKISLREGEKSNPPAKVEKLLCASSAWVEDTTLREGRLVSYKRIEGVQLFADCDSEKNDNIVQVDGPGRVRIFQLGEKGEMYPGQKQAMPAGSYSGQARPQTPTKEQEFKLTQVTFQGEMKANNKQGIARFYEDVVVVHVPTDDRDLKINELLPPPDSFVLRCRNLVVLSHKLADGAVQQEMQANKKVTILGQDFEASADTAKYDESKGLMVLEGTPGNLAQLVRQPVKGGKRQTNRALKIFYWPKTGQFVGDETRMLSGGR
jgi:hypothetical protein